MPNYSCHGFDPLMTDLSLSEGNRARKTQFIRLDILSFSIFANSIANNKHANIVTAS